MVKNKVRVRVLVIMGCVLVAVDGYAAYANEQLSAQEAGLHVPVIRKLAYDGDNEQDEGPSDAELFNARELSVQQWKREIEAAIEVLKAAQESVSSDDRVAGSAGSIDVRPGGAAVQSGSSQDEPKSWVKDILESNEKAELARLQRQEKNIKEMLQFAAELSTIQQEQLKLLLESGTDSEESSD